MQKSLLILSGGLDSSVSAAMAKQETALCCALFFDYGQRALIPEYEAAQQIAAWLDCPIERIPIPWLSLIGNSSLTHLDKTIFQPEMNDLDDPILSQESARNVWVPNRNGIFLNIAAAIAESREIDLLITGFNKEEAQTFPDNSEEFVEVASRFFGFSTQNKVQVKSYTIAMNKTEILQKALELKVPLEKTWSCYTDGHSEDVRYQGGRSYNSEAIPKRRPCGECESCLRSLRAYRQAGIENHYWE